MEEAEVGEQMEAQDFLQPQAEQPELQVPEDLNLDDDAMDQDGGADAEADAAEQDTHEAEDEATANDLGAHPAACSTTIRGRLRIEFGRNSILYELPWLSNACKVWATALGNRCSRRHDPFSCVSVLESCGMCWAPCLRYISVRHDLCSMLY